MDNGKRVEEEFMRDVERERGRFAGKRPNVLVCGYTGCGKTSLIQAICGEELVADHAIGDAEPTTTGFDEYAGEHVRVWDSKGLEPGEREEEFADMLTGFLRERRETSDVEEHVHLVWYAIQAPGARVTDCDIRLLTEVLANEHVIVVLTKADIGRAEQIDAMRGVLTEAGIDPKRIVATSDARSGAIGCQELMELSHAMLPAAYRDSFLEAQRIDAEAREKAVLAKRGKAAAIVAAATATATGIGATPIPIADAALLIPVQTGMVAGLAALYGLRHEALQHAVLPFVARVVGIYAASSLLKCFPFLGSVINAAVAGTLTGALGWFTLDRFEGMALAKVRGEHVPGMDFDLETFRKYYAAFWKEGKTTADANTND
jgi:uncharacterized protein (DUF697 family)/ethanolamine utilization protein EutP (predicted NTPase)